MFKKILVTLIGLLVFVPSILAQEQSLYWDGCGRYRIQDSLPMPKWEPHLSVGTGFVATSYGDNRMYSTVAPSLAYHPNNKLTVTGGFRITSDLGLNPNYNLGSTRSLAPRRRNGGTGLVSAELAAQYKVGENVWLAAALYHMSGQYAPMYGFANGSTLDVSATAIAASAAFRFNNDNYLHLYVSFIRDHAGTMPYLLYDTFCSGWGRYGDYGWPYNRYGMMSTGAMGFGGWYY